MTEPKSHRHRHRRHDATRGRILAAATELAHEAGWPSVTMRKIADRIDYTHPALYAYFPTTEALLRALLQEGLQLFRAALQAAAAAAPSPEAAVIALTAALWDFPWAHPELYQVMHGLGGVAFVTDELQAEERSTVEPALAAVGALLAKHGRDPLDAERWCVLQWATIHGIVSLTMAGRFTREEGAALATLAGRNLLVTMSTPP